MVCLLALAALLSASASRASVPQLINYQGTLTNSAGNPVADGQYNMAFSIYEQQTGGTALWTETWDATSGPVSTVGGVFNVMLGGHTPFPASFFADHTETYLGIKVGTDSEMVPRQRVASVGYALSAGNGVPKGAVIMWSGAVDKIPQGWALCDGSNGTPDLRGKFIAGAGSASYPVGATGGAASVNLQHGHTINEHTHTVGMNPGGAHQHSGTTSEPTGSTTRAYASDGRETASTAHTHTLTTVSGEGAHAHNGWTGGPSNTGTSAGLTANQDVRPPYYALAFIIKL